MQEEPRLREIPYFERLSDAELAELEELLEPVSFEVEELIFEEGGLEEWVYVITAGTVEVHKQILPGRTQLLATMDAPTVVGEMGLLTEPRAAASVVAKTSVEAQGMRRDRFLEVLNAGSLAACKVVHEIGRTLADRMARTNESVAEILTDLERRDRDKNWDLDLFQDHLIREWTF